MSASLVDLADKIAGAKERGSERGLCPVVPHLLGSLFLHLLFPSLAHLPWVPEQETLAQSQKEFDQVPGTLGLSPGLVV